MDRRPKKPEPKDGTSATDVADWAAKIAEAVDAAELKQTLARYNRLSRDRSISASDRAAAKERAKALKNRL